MRLSFLILLAGITGGVAASLDFKPQDPASPEIFTDVTLAAQITWVHFNGESDDRFLIEAMGGGVAFLDFDRDGRLDIFFVNGGETPRGRSFEPVRNALYRNVGQGRFENVAAHAGLAELAFYGMGVAAGDYDNDGFTDLYVTGYPDSALFRNNGNGTFTDVTGKAGVSNSGKWAASAAWVDYNRDGLIDLLVCNYAKMSFSDPLRCEMAGFRAYCEQKAYQGEPLALYRNKGDRTFEDASARSGVQKYIGRALGVVAIDVNNEAWPDLFVARDASPNLLLVNRRNGTFEDFSLDAEVAYDSNGVAKAGMGVDAGDVNGDGWPDFVVTNFNDEYHSLFLGAKSFPYEDWTMRSRLAEYSKACVGWGTHFLDYDNDTDLDLVIVNGHINQVIELARHDVTYDQPPLLLRNSGDGLFENVNHIAGPVFQARHSARGLAVGDFDNDGDVDIVFTRLKAGPLLLRNNVGQRNPWIGFQLVGTRSNRDAIGAKVTVQVQGKTSVRWITGGGSYLSSHDTRVLFGLPGLQGAVDAEVRWPSGELQKLAGLQPNRYHLVREAATASRAAR